MGSKVLQKLEAKSPWKMGSKVLKVLQELEAKSPWKMGKVLQLEAKSPWKMGKVLQLEAKSPRKMGKRHTYELCDCENENVKFETKNFDLCGVESNMPLKMAVQQFFYSLLSKQERQIQLAPVMINENETCHVIRILHTSMFLLTCSYNTSFLARLLIIMDGDVESNPGPNDIDFSIKK